MIDINTAYVNFWGKTIVQPEFTEMEIAVMEGGHSIDTEQPEPKFAFIKSLPQNESL